MAGNIPQGYELPVNDSGDEEKATDGNHSDEKKERSIPVYKAMSPKHAHKHKVPKADSEWLNDTEV